MKRRHFISSSGLAGAVAALTPGSNLRAATATGGAHADLIIANGRIYTMDENLPMAESVVVLGDRIIAVGTNDELKPLQGPRTRVIDATGCTVTPGFIDAHSHPDGANEVTGADVDLRSIREIKAAMRAEAGKTPPGQWVIGNKYDDTRHPHQRRRDDRDGVERLRKGPVRMAGAKPEVPPGTLLAGQPGVAHKDQGDGRDTDTVLHLRPLPRKQVGG